MIIVRVELWSARTGRITELARMRICNDGTGSAETGHYRVATFRGRSKAALDRGIVTRQTEIRDYQRNRLHVWNLVARALEAIGYG